MSSLLRDCSLFIGSTGPVFCGKTHGKVIVPSAKISKKVGVPSVEGRKKVHVPYNYTILTLCQRRNMLWPTVITTYSWRSGGAVSPPTGPGQGPGRGPEGEAPGSSEAPAFYRIRKPKINFILLKMTLKLWTLQAYKHLTKWAQCPFQSPQLIIDIFHCCTLFQATWYIPKCSFQ